MPKGLTRAVSARVGGEVQRVGFRRFVEHAAREFKLTGFVENREDGTAFIFVQGGAPEVDRFLAAVKNAPPPIVVEYLEPKAAKARPSLRSFTMKLGSMPLELEEGFGGMETQFAGYRAEFRDFAERTVGGFKSLGGKLDGFASRTDENFRLLSEKHGEISTNPTQVLETLQKESADTRVELRRSVDNLSRLVDEYIAQGKKQGEK